MLLQLVSFLFLLTSACIPTSYCLITGNSLLHARLESHGLGKLHAVAKKNDSVRMYVANLEFDISMQYSQILKFSK